MMYLNRIVGVMLLAGVTQVAACSVLFTSSSAAGASLLVIRVRQDVAVRPRPLAAEQRGVLYGDTALVIRKGERFDMVAQTQEGGCRIRYAARVIELASCPWLPGFTDPQRDIFEIVTPVSPSRSHASKQHQER